MCDHANKKLRECLSLKRFLCTETAVKSYFSESSWLGLGSGSNYLKILTDYRKCSKCSYSGSVFVSVIFFKKSIYISGIKIFLDWMQVKLPVFTSQIPDLQFWLLHIFALISGSINFIFKTSFIFHCYKKKHLTYSLTISWRQYPSIPRNHVSEMNLVLLLNRNRWLRYRSKIYSCLLGFGGIVSKPSLPTNMSITTYKSQVQCQLHNCRGKPPGPKTTVTALPCQTFYLTFTSTELVS